MMKYNHIVLNNLIACLIIISTQLKAYATNDEPTKYNKAPAWLEAIKMQNQPNWQEFKKQKELMDINYDLYRMRIRGPNLKEQIISAQDPKGYFLQKHDNTFCSPQVDSKCQLGSPLYTYGDIKVNVLLDNLYQEREKIDLATEIIRNIINPFPSNIALEMLEATEKERKDPKNQAALAETYASQARLGVARNTFHNMFFNRLPLDSLSDQKPSTKEKFSVISIMEKQAKKRFENPEWYEFIQKSDLEKSVKEMVEMESFRIWLDYQKYRQNERIEALLATLVAQQESMHKSLMKKDPKNN